MNTIKISTIIILLFGMISCSSSQHLNKDFTDFYKHHQDDNGVVSFSLPIGLAKILIDDDDDDAKKILGKLNKMRFFICEKDNGFYTKAIEGYLPEPNYHDLMVIRDGAETVVFKIKEPVNGKIKEIILTVSKPDSFVAISFNGNFDMEDAREMTSSVKRGNLGDIRL